MISLEQLLTHLPVREVRNLRPAQLSQAVCHPADGSGAEVIFVCMDEYLRYNEWQTWRSHLEWIAQQPLGAVVLPEAIPGIQHPQIIVSDPRRVLARIAALLNGEPATQLRLHGVTGTNGKTTTTHMIAHALNRLGMDCGLMGTMGASIAAKRYSADPYTTPLAPTIHRQLAHFLQDGATAAAMEVSSHALALDRVHGLRFTSATLTNIGRDHLDFHGTETAYIEAKSQLFRMIAAGGHAVLNADSPHYGTFATVAEGCNILKYSTTADNNAALWLSDWQGTPDGSCARFHYQGETCQFSTGLVGRFQLENLLAALGVLLAEGIPLTEACAAMEGFSPVPGRMQKVALANGASALVDYAHNPDGLRSLLLNCRPWCRGRLLLVFGCGGDRDKGKRPQMGAIAAELADAVWVTSDNPRTEDPHNIIDDILKGFPAGVAPVVEEDRRAAIKAAAAATAEGDLLVIAGKGHEDYQIIGHTKLPFSDLAVLTE